MPHDPSLLSATSPFARLVVRDDLVFLHEWDRRLTVVPTERALYEQIANAGVFLADLCEDSSDGVSELFIEPLPGHALSISIGDVISNWAASCGRQRLWLPDHVIDLDKARSHGLSRRAECPVCGWTFEDSSLALTAWISKSLRTPSRCLACGSGSLPQAVSESLDPRG